MLRDYAVIVIGGGHAGTEAAWAAANALQSVGSEEHVALITMDPSKIGAMSCNPAIGGLAKGQIVREIDALGGLMGLATDATGIQFRMLNMSKGPAVRGPRAQCDKYAYAAEVQRLIASQKRIDVLAATVDDLVVENGRVVGVLVPTTTCMVEPEADAIEWNGTHGGLARPVFPMYGPSTASAHDETLLLRAKAVVLTTGTFMRGLMHTGEARSEGGRVGEGAAVGISATLKRLGFDLGRLKTGTPPRLASESIQWNELVEQKGDGVPTPFSDLSPEALRSSCFPVLPQISCYQSYTTKQAHDLIRANLDRAPMFTGQIDAECGPRYCPSIEDKIVRFADRDSHHVFLEPESLHTNEVYCNGISTSLPTDVQDVLVHTMPGCERAKILRWGYAVEYDMVWPHQIQATCMTRGIHGLFLAGQINCTTGYEEAGAQGLVAGVNAARLAVESDPIIIGRDQGYIGVMMDDLVTRTPREPYRMFTSRAEYRLLLRSDNADMRLTPLGRDLGLVDDRRWNRFTERCERLRAIERAFTSTKVNGSTLRDYSKRGNVTVADVIARLDPHIARGDDGAQLVSRVMSDVQYEGYIARQVAEIKRQKKSESMRVPEEIDFRSIVGLRAETAEVLTKFRPATLGQAGRLAGVTPADVTILAVAIRRFHESSDARRTT